MIREIRESIQNGDFVPFYQPIMCSSTNTIIGAEVLARWLHPIRGLLMPGEFIPVVEKENLGVDLTMSLMSKVAQDLANIEKPTELNFYVSFNITSDMLADDLFFHTLIGNAIKMKRFGVSTMVEFIERHFYESTEILLHKINELKKHHISIALDDFGTGFSNFSCLDSISPDCIKIDRLFTSGLGIKNISKIIISSIIDVSKKLNITVVSEGVESEEQLNMLANMDSFIIQGYYFSKPLPYSEFSNYFYNHSMQSLSDNYVTCVI